MTEGVALGGRLILPGAQSGSHGRKEGAADSHAFTKALQTKISIRQETDVVEGQEPDGGGSRLAELLEKLSFAAHDDDAPANDKERQLPIPGEEEKAEAIDEGLPITDGKEPPMEADTEANVPSVKGQAMQDGAPAKTAADAEQLGDRYPLATKRDAQPAPAAKADLRTVVEPALRQPGPDQANAAKSQQPAAPTGGGSMPEPAAPNGRTTGTVAPLASQDSGLQEKNSGGRGQDNNSGKQPFRVVGQQSAPSPAAIPMAGLSSTGTALAGALAADPGFSQAAAEAAQSTATAQTAATKSLHTLKIQLHPVELGIVTARLSISGEQLVVELSVETNEARQRLGADSEAMTRALRALGYEVDRVTIQQAPHAPNAGTNASPAGRDGGGFAADGGDGQRGNNARNGGGEETGRGKQGRTEEDKNAATRDSLYI